MLANEVQVLPDKQIAVDPREIAARQQEGNKAVHTCPRGLGARSGLVIISATHFTKKIMEDFEAAHPSRVDRVVTSDVDIGSLKHERDAISCAVFEPEGNIFGSHAVQSIDGAAPCRSCCSHPPAEKRKSSFAQFDSNRVAAFEMRIE